MEVILDNPVIKVTKSDVENTRRFYGIDLKSINEIIDAVLDWAKKQEHLAEAAEYLDRAYLERVLLLSRGSLEGTKNKVEKLCTTRGMMADMCLNHNLDEYDKLLGCINVLPMPRISQTDHTRVILTKFVSENFDDFTMLSYLRYCFLVGEYRLHYEYVIGERHVIDLKHIKLSLLGKVNPIILKKGEILSSEVYGTKIKGIHLLNAPPFVDKLVFVLKSVLKEKLANRIHVHSTYEDLHKYIPKETLPKDYGGDEPSTDKLAEQWKEIFRTEEATKIIGRLEKRISNESKRTGGKFSEEYMGMPGSFRRLNVD